jgi:hypothetical protein
MRYIVDDLLMESGLFWCVFEATPQGRPGRLVQAFFGQDADTRAKVMAERLNGEAK